MAVMMKAADPASWTMVYQRIDTKREEAGLSWSQLAKLAGIKMKTWMTGLPISHPTESEVRKIANVPQMNTTYEYLRYGIEN